MEGKVSEAEVESSVGLGRRGSGWAVGCRAGLEDSGQKPAWFWDVLGWCNELLAQVLMSTVGAKKIEGL